MEIDEKPLKPDEIVPEYEKALYCRSFPHARLPPMFRVAGKFQ